MPRPLKAAGITVARHHRTGLVIEGSDFEICWGTTPMVTKKHRAKRSVKRSGRVYRRDAKGRFASSGTAAPTTSPEAADLKRRVRHRRAAVVAGTAAVAATAASQVHPASRTRTAITRRTLVKSHVARAASDHRKSVTRRARALPHRPTPGAAFPKSAHKAATTEARKLTKGYRRQLKRTRKARRRSR